MCVLYDERTSVSRTANKVHLTLKDNSFTRAFHKKLATAEPFYSSTAVKQITMQPVCLYGNAQSLIHCTQGIKFK